ncbi:hypothetical protein [Acidianus sp. RZ1]|uniref:hypothetical protein n=1 Tax=Acidianus sp. RZ1 TaxID=1540082 RepID=UPI0014916679|nr:hypothetical protein [Acidianus sp. RZ1]NON62847.1 hypothetical protein [Acidianus sp. RZ1]
MNWTKDPSNVISAIPNVIGINGNIIRLKFTRFIFASLESDFLLEPSFLGSGMVEYKLIDNKENEIKIIFSKYDKGIKISIGYSGEKEWVVGKSLKTIVEQITNNIEKEIKNVKMEPNNTMDFSTALSKISMISKIIMKSKLVKTEDVELTLGQVPDYIQQTISDFKNYQMIYVSGSGSSIFRAVFIGGELKGVYVMNEGKDTYNEESLNKLQGHFKINVYVSIIPKAVETLQEELGGRIGQ